MFVHSAYCPGTCGRGCPVVSCCVCTYTQTRFGMYRPAGMRKRGGVRNVGIALGVLAAALGFGSLPLYFHNRHQVGILSGAQCCQASVMRALTDLRAVLVPETQQAAGAFGSTSHRHTDHARTLCEQWQQGRRVRSPPQLPAFPWVLTRVHGTWHTAVTLTGTLTRVDTRGTAH